eukprot:6908308-Pyramimonas_sp.AAC.1
MHQPGTPAARNGNESRRRRRLTHSARGHGNRPPTVDAGRRSKTQCRAGGSAAAAHGERQGGWKGSWGGQRC